MTTTTSEQRVIQNGIHFMQSITAAYGADAGLQLWETIANTLDPSLKGKIFFALLTDQYADSITILGLNNMCDKISLIKALRTVDRRRLGLKEAKDLADILWTNKPISIEVEPASRTYAISQLTVVGCII